MANPNPSELKGAINSGKTGDKVAGFDPAAAPLGTDAETGGSPPSRQETAQALRLEIGRTPTRKASPVWLIILGGTALSLLAGLALAVLGSPPT